MKKNAFCYQADGVGLSKLVRFLFGLFVTIIRKNKKKLKLSSVSVQISL